MLIGFHRIEFTITSAEFTKQMDEQKCLFNVMCFHTCNTYDAMNLQTTMSVETTMETVDRFVLTLLEAIGAHVILVIL